MERPRSVYHVRCPYTGVLRPLERPIQFLIHHGGMIGAAAATGLLITSAFWVSGHKVPAIRHCDQLIIEAAGGQWPLKGCETTAAEGSGWLPSSLAKPFSQSPSPSAPRRGSSAD